MDTKPLYLNGRWAATEAAIEVVNPASGEVIGRVATADAAGRGPGAGRRGRGLGRLAKVARPRPGCCLSRIADALAPPRRRECPHDDAGERQAACPEPGRGGVERGPPPLVRREAGRAYGRVVPNQVPASGTSWSATPVGVVGAKSRRGIFPWCWPCARWPRRWRPAAR